MTESRTPLILRVIPHLPKAEKVFLTGLAIGIILLYSNGSGKILVQVSLGALAIIFFLSAFTLIDVPRTKDEPELLAWIIT